MNSAVNLRSANSDNPNNLLSNRPPIAQKSQPSKPVQTEASDDVYEAVDNVDDVYETVDHVYETVDHGNETVDNLNNVDEEPAITGHSIKYLNNRRGFMVSCHKDILPVNLII